ncbi:MAG TPA: hypothetical protein VN618_15420 [Solirubrobacteraceae bacterium]|nr:hypothetical protein [Solirubrobacteraceae bacterium]
MRAVNLIPTDQRSGASVGAGRSGGAAYAVLGLLVIVAALAVLYGKANRAASADKSKAATLNAEAQQAQAAAQALAPYTAFVALREQREQAVAALVDTRFDWAHAIHEFGRVLTKQVSITSLDGSIGGAATSTAVPTPPPTGAAGSSAAVTSATPAGSVPTFQITGCATSQHAVADTMQRLRLIDGVSEVTLQSSTKTGSSGGGGAASAGGSSGSCGPGHPVFAMTVTFSALPSASASAAAASAKTSSVAETTVTTPSSGGGAG